MVESEKFDALIIGAGPAGSFAAEQLARGGARVALFDGRPPGEPKACGGGVTSKALKAWPHLLEASARTIEEVEMYSPAGTRVRLKLDAPFAIYSRVAFDSYLRDRAVRAGARVIPERVSVALDKDGPEGWTARARDGASWRGLVLVAADGANSPIARGLAGALPNAEMEVAFGYRAPLPKGDDAPTVIAFLPGWAGYAWAFPRLDHISFGIATSQDAFDHRSLDALLWEFMIGYYRIREDPHAPLWSSQAKGSREGELHGAEIEKKLRASVDRYAARIPGLAVETWNTRRVGSDTWALLGDAAGFADPVTGEGIYYALRSAELFAESYLAGCVSDYEERWRADFGRELRRASAMRGRFYGEFLGAPFTDRMIDFARLHPGIRRTLRELVAGAQGYVNLKRALARSALWPL
jgi:flavin-dependent dehydrogenase